jgi:exodeoxyribonuclease-3
VKFPAKAKFYADLLSYLKNNHTPDDKIILMGDMNISHQDCDIGIGEDNRKRWLRTGKCSFLPEEREWLTELLAWGFKDTFRKLNPDTTNLFSWFDYRSGGFEDTPKRGLRIDLILATESLQSMCVDTGIDYDIRGMEKTSDHCPIWATFKK